MSASPWDRDTPQKQPHLGQQVLNPAALSQLLGEPGGWAAAPSWGHFLPLQPFPFPGQLLHWLAPPLPLRVPSDV